MLSAGFFYLFKVKRYSDLFTCVRHPAFWVLPLQGNFSKHSRTVALIIKLGVRGRQRPCQESYSAALTGGGQRSPHGGSGGHTQGAQQRSAQSAQAKADERSGGRAHGPALVPGSRERAQGKQVHLLWYVSRAFGARYRGLR